MSETYADGRTPPERVPKSERILNLIAVLLRSDDPVPIHEILGKVTGYDDKASRESLMRRFERDKKVLRDMGIPVEHVAPGAFGFEGYKIPRDAYFLDEVSLPAGSGQILRGLFASARLGGGDVSPELRSALVKLGFFLEEGNGGEAGAAGPAAPSQGAVDPKLSTGPEVSRNLELLSEAVFRQRRVRMRYYTIGRDEVNDREVDPYGLGFAGQAWNRGAWYLVGYCHLREDVRVFKVQRIRGEVALADPKSEGQDFEIPGGFRVREHLGRVRWEYKDLARAFAGEEDEDPFVARVRFEAAVAGEVRSLVPSAEVVARADGAETLAFTVHERRPFVRFLLRYAPRFEVLEPAGLEDDVRALAREVLALYEAAG